MDRMTIEYRHHWNGSKSIVKPKSRSVSPVPTRSDPKSRPSLKKKQKKTILWTGATHHQAQITNWDHFFDKLELILYVNRSLSLSTLSLSLVYLIDWASVLSASQDLHAEVGCPHLPSLAWCLTNSIWSVSSVIGPDHNPGMHPGVNKSSEMIFQLLKGISFGWKPFWGQGHHRWSFNWSLVFQKLFGSSFGYVFKAKRPTFALQTQYFALFVFLKEYIPMHALHSGFLIGQP